MANIQFPRKEIEKYLKLTQETIDKITLFGTQAELSDEHLEIEIYPNRPDLIPMQGFLRAFKAFEGKEKGIKKYKLNKPEKNYKIKVDHSVKEIRPYTACAIVKNLKLSSESIKDIMNTQEKLHATLGRNRKKLAIGTYPLEKIKLPITYIAKKPEQISFIPLGEKKLMTAKEILSQHPKGKEFAELLSKKTIYPLFIDANKKILSMPPIINSTETGQITEKTEEIFIECSGFDLELCKKILIILVTSLAEIGGKIYQMELDYGKKELTPSFETETMKLTPEEVNKTLGVTLKEKDLEKLLPRMEYEYHKGTVKIPPWRTDILNKIDIIEDIAIAYGYDKLIPQIPNVCTIGAEDTIEEKKNELTELLIGLSLQEITSLHLIKESESDTSDLIEIKNSKTEFNYLRPSLLIPALRTLATNKDNEYPQKIFELGKVFKKNKNTETGVEEIEKITIVLTPGNVTETKKILDYILKKYTKEYTLKESSVPLCIEGRAAEIIINGKKEGYIGELHPETLINWNLKMSAAVLELNLSALD